jgi:hypothetical protein
MEFEKLGTFSNGGVLYALPVEPSVAPLRVFMRESSNVFAAAGIPSGRAERWSSQNVLHATLGKSDRGKGNKWGPRPFKFQPAHYEDSWEAVASTREERTASYAGQRISVLMMGAADPENGYYQAAPNGTLEL